MGSSGLEPPTSRLSGVRSNQLSYKPLAFYSVTGNGDGEIRTLDPLLARQVLSQLSYAPILMGLSGLEPPTSRLSGVRSNRLSYEPIDSGDHLLSQAASHQVPSTAQVLTVVFGMGTGVSPERIITEDV